MSMKERDLKMKELYLSGKTLQEIGDIQSPPITRERVRQILKSLGIDRYHGGASIKSFVYRTDKEMQKKKKKEERTARMLGCGYEFFYEVNSGKSAWTKNTPARSFMEHRRNSKKREIEFKLTFKEWWDIWQESGKWELRGRGEGYCMARIGNTGGYEVGNVEIKTIGENFSESYFKHSWLERFKDKHTKEFCKRGHKLSETRYEGTSNCRECQKIRKAKRSKKNNSRDESSSII